MSRSALLVLLVLLAAPAGGRAQIVVTIEAAGVQESSVLATKIVGTFDAAAAGRYPGFSGTVANFTPATTYAYSSGGAGATSASDAIQIVAPNDVGGARTSPTNSTRTNYFSVGAQSGQPTAKATLTQAGSQGMSYFGLWISALDAQNNLDFYNGSKLVATFNADAITNSGKLTGTRNSTGAGTGHYGNPNNSNANGNESYVFVNFYAANNAASKFDTVVFRNNGTGTGFESDNHTFAFDYAQTAADYALLTNPLSPGFIQVLPVPEPATALAAVAGLLALGRLARRRRAG